MMETTHLLPALGFTPAPNAADKKAFILHLGPLKLSAARTQNLYFREVVIFWSSYVTPNTLSEIYFELPKEIQSLDHVKAFLSYYLKGHVGRDTIPTPLWFDEGISLGYLLPWEVESPKYESRLHCYVRKGWMKLMLKDLASALEAAAGDAQVEFYFDGTVLSVSVDGHRIVTNAEGKAWDCKHSISASRLANLPNRLHASSIEVEIHGNRLRLGRRSYAGITTGGVPDRYESVVKPAIAAAFAEVDQGNTPLETMVNLLNALEARGLNEDQIRTMTPDIVHFAKEECTVKKDEPQAPESEDTTEVADEEANDNLKSGTRNLLSRSQKTEQPSPELIWKQIMELVAVFLEENETRVQGEMDMAGAGKATALLSKLHQFNPKKVVRLLQVNNLDLVEAMKHPHEATPEQKEQILNAVLDLFTPSIPLKPA